MASLERRKDSFRIVFRHAGRKYAASVPARDRRHAETLLGNAEDRLRQIGLGTAPPFDDLAAFVALGQTAESAVPVPKSSPRLGDLFERYRASADYRRLEPTTRYTCDIHLKHLAAVANVRAADLKRADLQKYADARPVAAVTKRKELTTLSAVWTFALREELVAAPLPRGVDCGREADKPPFATYAEIERAGGDWDRLFLDVEQVEAVVGLAEGYPEPWLAPAVALAAYAGLRRSEVLRCRPEDLDLERGTVTVREKKRVRGRDSRRTVPLPARTLPTFEAWDHPAVTRDMATYHLKGCLRGTKWEVVKGWHTLRHSFASNCAAAGVDERTINAWMGHSGEAMARRYRHLFPDAQRRDIERVFG